MTKYHRLTQAQRASIITSHNLGCSSIEIAKELAIHRTTVTRELKRNSNANGEYNAKDAQERADRRQAEVRSKKTVLTADMVAEIESRLKEGWSPEQISCRFKKEGRNVSMQSIYNHINADRKQGGTLYKCLRHKGKPYKKKAGEYRYAGRGHIPNRTDISERPKVVDKKKRCGDYEVDLIIGKNHQGAILTIVDRKTKFTLGRLLNSKHADAVAAALIELLRNVPAAMKHTLTFDNGKEFAKHLLMCAALEMDSYFAKPYHSWERGLNEHTNGLLREYFPKGTDFTLLHNEEVQAAIKRINQRPRVVLKGFTPEERFEIESKKHDKAS